MFTYLFLFFIGYILFQIIFRFVLPIYKATKQVRRGFQDVHNRMNGEPAAHEQPRPQRSKQRKPVGDYIEFEEVK